VCGIRARGEAAFGQANETPDLSADEIKTRECNDDPPCGLVIIGTERHEARRIDRQLRGRSGRQGDPGQSVFFLSLEDDLMRLFGSDRIARWMDKSGAQAYRCTECGESQEKLTEKCEHCGRTGTLVEENEVITHPLVTRAIGQAQKRVELQNFQSRKRLLEYDDVMNQQRDVIYSLRLFALEGGEELRAEAARMVEQAIERQVDQMVAATDDPGQWDRKLMETELLQKFLLSVADITDPRKIKNRDDLVAAALQAARDALAAKTHYLKEIETKVGGTGLAEQVLSFEMLRVIDEKWKDHLYDLDQLRAAIQYRAWGQKDPLVEYKQEAYGMFVDLMHDLHSTFAERWLKLQVQIGPAPRPGQTVTGPLGGPKKSGPMIATKPAADGLISPGTSTGPKPPPAPPGVPVAASPYAGVGRNDPCPCGSGKKFKKCHGANL
jgi:preprotein translocase subunit SecA